MDRQFEMEGVLGKVIPQMAVLDLREMTIVKVMGTWKLLHTYLYSDK